MRVKREKCGGPSGKLIYATRDEARADLPVFRERHRGKGSVKRCTWGEHYHLTKGLHGRKGKGTQWQR